MGQWKSAAVKTIIKPDRARAREYERFFSGMTVLILGIVFWALQRPIFWLGRMAATDLLRRDGAALKADDKTLILIFFAFRERFNPAAHKRLILIATITLMEAAMNQLGHRQEQVNYRIRTGFA
jgi:hypothetical protein